MRKLHLLALVTGIIFAVSACGGGTDVVESGTYTGTIDELNPQETEIYVVTDNNTRLELYFTDSTQLTQNGQTIPFSTLKTGQKVEVAVEESGEHLNPISVKLLE